MAPVLDHVRERRLETTLSGGVTRHTFRQAATNTQTDEVWKRERLLSRRPEGLVWVETCIEGPKKGESRAVKSIFKRIGSHNIDFKQELDALGIFSQPPYLDSFVGYYGWFEDSDTIYLAMELFMLGDLSRFMSRPFSEAEVRHLVSQLVRGVAFMHSQNFSHRDLKPQNILVKESHPRWSVRIADFGISKRITDTTNLHTEIGTRHYMAPEIMGFFTIEDLKLDSPRDSKYSLVVDVWSLGVLAFQLLTNSLPFPDLRALSSFVTLGMSSPFEGLSQFNPSVACDEFIKSCLARSPLWRPAAADLEAHVWLKGASDEAYDSTPFINNSAQIGSSPTDIEQEFFRFEITDPSGDWDTVRPTVRVAELPRPLQFSPGGTTTYRSSEIQTLNTTIGDEEFVFDDVVINSAAYRKAFAKQMKRIENNDTVKPQTSSQKRVFAGLFARFRQRRQSPPGGKLNQPSPGDTTNLPRGYEVLPGGRAPRMSALDGQPAKITAPNGPAAGQQTTKDDIVETPSVDPGPATTDAESEPPALPDTLPFFKDYCSEDDIRPGDQVSVVWAYQPRAPDEFALERGDMIKISHIWDDGWGTGVMLDLRAEEWDEQRNGGAEKDEDLTPPYGSGGIGAFPMVIVTLPQHWKKAVIAADYPGTT